MKNKNKLNGADRISRRAFINRTAAGTAVFAALPVTALIGNDVRQVGSWPPGAEKFTFHMIGQAHIDPVWLWPWTEGISIVHSTFRSALDRMNETPDFCFTASSAQFYQWVAENDPGMIAEIRQRMLEGRWDIVGGWWVEPDMNIPAGEAMVRQGLYGQLTFQRILGRRATVAFNPDSFGHTRTLPQIIHSQGMDNYVFMRPAPNEKTLPANLFWWEGLDGTRVLTYRIPLSYNDNGSVRNRVEQVLKVYGDQPMKTFMAFFGAGDHGGGATKENIRSIEEIRAEKGAPALLFSTTGRYFKEVRDDKNLNLPVVKDDLQHHAVGCYTAESAIKKGNRLSESALVTAEKIAAIGFYGWGAKYPMQELTAAWQRVLFLQFHDSLAGSSLHEHSQAAQEGYGYALDIAHQALYLAVQKLEWQVPAEDPGSQYLLVFNPHAWEVRGPVEYDFNWGTTHKSSRVEEERGSPLLHQWTAGSSETGSRRKLIVDTIIPPMGYRQIRLLEGEANPDLSTASATSNTLENESLRVHFSASGSLGIFDKDSGREMFSGGETGCRAVVIDDPSDTWSHEVKTFSNETGVFEKATINILENGPLRATMRVISTYGASSLTIDWTLYADSRNLVAKITLDWQEHLKMLKFSFPLGIESPVATYETPYGHIERPANGDEEPGLRWIDLTGQRSGASCGLTVINDAKYGYSVHGNDLRISVARAAVYAHHNPKVLDMKAEHLWMDQGIQTFRMLLVPHEGSWKSVNIPRIADEFLVPLISIYQGIHGGSMPKSGSFLSVDAPGVAVTAVKQSESGEDLIIRCVEMMGQPAAATVDLRFAGRKWSGNFRPGEIKTLRLNPESGRVTEVNLLEE